MKNFKNILKYLGFALIGLVIGGLLLPYVFKDKLMAYLKENINKNVEAHVTFHDANLSLFSSFPDVRVSIDSLNVTGIDDFDGIVLYKAVKTNIDISLPSLLGSGKTPKINSILLKQPEINIIVLDSLRANYLITAQDTTQQQSSNYQLQLDEYAIEDGKINYNDHTMNLFVSMDNVNHSGKGDFTQDVFDLTTKTKADKLTVEFDGIKYLKNASTDLNAGFNINFPESKYTLLDNKLRINELDVNGQGFVQLKGDDMITDFTFSTASESFQSLLSMIPNAYTADFKDVKTQGKASFKGIIKGVYNEKMNKMPAFVVDIKVDNGYVKYPGMPMAVSDIFADMKIKASRSDYKDMQINIPAFKMKLDKDAISGKLLANNLTGDQKVEGFLKGTLNLQNLSTIFPMEEGMKVSGTMACDIDFKAKMSDVNAENYEAIAFKGNAEAKNIKYQSKGMPVISLPYAKAAASPQKIEFSGDNMQLGKSDLTLAASIQNPLAAFSTEKNVAIDIISKSKLFDMNEWMTETPAETTANSQSTYMADEKLLQNSKMNVNAEFDKILMNEYVLDKLKVAGSLAANSIKIDQFTAMIGENDLAISGIVANAYNYFFGNGVLKGDIRMTSNNFDANKFMSAETSKTAEPLTVIPVPANVDIQINTNIKNLTYTNLNLKDFSGILQVANQEVALKDVKTNTLGGTISLDGLYGTKDLAAPYFSVKLDLSKIKYVEAIKKIEMLQKAAPIAAYIDGFFNTTLVMKGKLGAEMTPDLSTLDASGFLETLQGTLKGFNPLGQLADKLGIKEINEVNFLNTKNWFEIAQGFVELKEYKKVVKDIDMTISGKHGFGKDMDYNIDLIIPRELLKKNKITGTAELGLSMIEKEASKLGINIDQGPNIFLNVKMTGNIKNPKFKITPKTGSGTSAGSVIESKVNETVATVKDSISKEIKKQEAKLKDTITKRVNQEVENAKSKAEDAARKALDSIKSRAKSEVITKIDTLTKGILTDSLKQKAKDAVGKKGQEEVDKIKDKLKDFNPFKKKGK